MTERETVGEQKRERKNKREKKMERAREISIGSDTNQMNICIIPSAHLSSLLFLIYSFSPCCHLSLSVFLNFILSILLFYFFNHFC